MKPKFFSCHLPGKLMKSALSLLALFSVHSCSADTDDKNFCALSCSDGIIGSSEMVIQPFLQSIEIGCLSTANTVRELEPTLVQFDVYKETETITGEIKKIPVPNVLITPLVAGSLGTNQTADDLKNDSKFRGIKTSPDEWCSDSCGVFTLEVIPVCIPGVEGRIMVGARSGSVTSEDFLEITIDDTTDIVDAQQDGNNN